jgi:small basic protein
VKGWTIVLAALIVGIALGVVGTLRLPSLAAPYLPASLVLPTRTVEAEVTKKLREPDRILLRLQVDHTLVLATFTRKVPEVDLLVQEGDTITVALPQNRTFVDDPVIHAVQHPAAAAAPAAPSPAQSR